MLTREALLAGLPAKRGSMLLFAIESRTARLVVRARRAMAPVLAESSAAARERLFLEALAQGRDLPVQPTIQDLERYAPQWVDLVPADPRLRAALAHALASKYRFMAGDVPALRQALGLGETALGEAFQRAYGRPHETIYATDVGRRERVRWMHARLAGRLESLPPFWTVFALTLTETVGAGTLALPIALSAVGPLPGLALLFVIGLLNVLTIAALAEAFSRNGAVRYNGAFFGRVVSDFLGSAGAVLLTTTLLMFSLASLLVYYVGLATTLAGVAGLPAEVWAALLFVVALAVLRRETLDATIAAALLVGAVNVGLILVMVLLVSPHVSTARLAAMDLPWLNGRPFDSSGLGAVLGVCLAAFFGHMSIGNCAPLVLRRDPSGRALIRGAVAATLVALALYSLWVVAVSGAVPSEALRGDSGTALAPLAAAAGPFVSVLGAVYVVLGMGMASVHVSRAVFLKMREWLPSGRMRGAFWLGIAPVLGVFLLVEWLLWQNQASFAGTLAFAGALKVPLLGATFPLLLLVASRRKGEYVPQTVIHWLGHPAIVAGVFFLFLASVLLHGAVIWRDPFQRLAAGLVGLSMLALPLICLRRGAFKARAVVELRADTQPIDSVSFAIVANGRPLAAEVRLEYADRERRLAAPGGEVPAFPSLRLATFDLPATAVRELKVWAHALLPDGGSEALPLGLEVRSGGRVHQVDLQRLAGQTLMPVDGAACRVRIAPVERGLARP